jgi:hypothetical protein
MMKYWYCKNRWLNALCVACACLLSSQNLYATPVQVIECSIYLPQNPLPIESVDTRFTIRRHIEHTEPVEEVTTSIWGEAKFENNGYFEVTVYPFDGEPRVERSTSTFTRVLDGNSVIGDEYEDQALTMEKTIEYEGYTLDSILISLKSDNGTAISDHLSVPEIIDRDAWDPYSCGARCDTECVVTWRVPGIGIPCATGGSAGGGLCTTGAYIGQIASLSTEPHDHDHGDGGSTFELNSGLNDAWVSADAAFQGMFVTVFPVLKLVFVAWFTFDVPPAQALEQNPGTSLESMMAAFGADDQRWITAVGAYDGNRAVLNAELTTGGQFNSSNPLPVQDTDYGNITLEFSDCSNGSVSFNFPKAGQSGEFAITRTLDDNVALCEELAAPASDE